MLGVYWLVAEFCVSPRWCHTHFPDTAICSPGKDRGVAVYCMMMLIVARKGDVGRATIADETRVCTLNF